LSLWEIVVASKRGRPAQTELEKSTHIRMKNDLVKMIGWIVRVQGGDASQFIDPLVRPVVIAKYAGLLPAIKTIKAATDQARIAEGLPPTDPLPEVVIVEVPTAPPVESEKKPKKKT
jgi:hypothetical protein